MSVPNGHRENATTIQPLLAEITFVDDSNTMMHPSINFQIELQSKAL